MKSPKAELFRDAGESASILMEQRQNAAGSQSTDKEDVREDESKGRKSNHVSMLQRNERQFYDNLLVNIYSFRMCFQLKIFCSITNLQISFGFTQRPHVMPLFICK